MTVDIENMFKDYTAAWNSHNAENIAEFFIEDYVHENVADGNQISLTSSR